MESNLPRRCLAEFIGTYCLVLLGCGAVVVNSQFDGLLSHAGVAVAWGLVVMSMIYAIGDISGAHINPAVSISFAMVKRLAWRDAVCYLLAQCTGALTAAASLAATLGIDKSLIGSTVTTLPHGVAFAVEGMMTGILMFVIMGVSTGAKEKSITAGLAVGATITMEALIAGPLTNASMNPARSLGPAFLSGTLDLLWIYMIAPPLGAICGAFLYNILRPNKST